MNDEPHAGNFFDIILDGGPLNLALHALMVGIAIYIIFRAGNAYMRRTQLPLIRFVLLSFLPLAISTLGFYAPFLILQDDFWGGLIVAAIYCLNTGWICTTLSLLSVYAASRFKRA